MALTLDRPPGTSEIEVLIREARRHRRRRWVSIGSVLLLAFAGTAVGLTMGHGGPTGNRLAHHHPAVAPSPPTSAPPTVPAVVAPNLNRPEALAVEPDGSLLIANQGTNQILRWTMSGGLSVFAGTGTVGYSGDGGSATSAELNEPSGMAVAPDGTVYVADTQNNAIRAVSPQGLISTIAHVQEPEALALVPGGALYVVDPQGVDAVSQSGSLTMVLSSGPGKYVINGTPTAFDPWAIAVDNDGNLYVGNFSPKLLMEFSPEGQLLNSWTLYVTPTGLATAPDGSIVVGDYGFFTVERLADGKLAPVSNPNVADSYPSLHGFRPSGVAVAPDGTVYTDDDGVNGVGATSLFSVSTSGKSQLLLAISPPTEIAP